MSEVVSQPSLQLHAPRGAGQRSLSTSYLSKFPDAPPSLAEPTRMALSLGLSTEELPTKLSSKSTTPPHSTHTSTELKQQYSTGERKLSSPGVDDALKMRPSSPSKVVLPVEMVPTPGSPRTERPLNIAPPQTSTQQAIPKVKSLSGMTAATNISVDEAHNECEGEEDKFSPLPPTAPPILPNTSTPVAPKEAEVQVPSTVVKKPAGKKLDLEALTSVTLPSAQAKANVVPQAKERAVTFSETGRGIMARSNTVSEPSPSQGRKGSKTSVPQGRRGSEASEDKSAGSKTRQLSRLEKLTSLDYIRASIRARRKKVSFSVADKKPEAKKNLKESVIIHNHNTSFGRSSPPPFSPSTEGYEEEDVFSPEPLGIGNFSRRQSGHEVILGYPQLSQPVYMPAYGGFVQLSQTYYPPLSQGIPYPYTANHLHPLQPEPFVYHDDLTPEDGYQEPGYSEFDRYNSNGRDLGGAYRDTRHTNGRETPDNTPEGGFLLTERGPRRSFPGGGPPPSNRQKQPSSDLDDSSRSPARLLNSDNEEPSNGSKPKSKPRVSWKPSVEYHSRTPDPDHDDEDDEFIGHRL